VEPAPFRPPIPLTKPLRQKFPRSTHVILNRIYFFTHYRALTPVTVGQLHYGGSDYKVCFPRYCLLIQFRRTGPLVGSVTFPVGHNSPFFSGWERSILSSHYRSRFFSFELATLSSSPSSDPAASFQKDIAWIASFWGSPLPLR